MALTKATFSMVTGAVANVLDYGADSTGTTDSTAAIQAAVDAGIGAVYFPSGTYKLNSQIDVTASTVFFGDGDSSIIEQSSSFVDDGAFGVLSTSSGATISGVRFSNIKFQNLTGTFSEFVSFVFLAGTTNAVIENCTFYGSRGDGVYVGYGPSNVERHNFNVTIRNCLFDGVNGENRNGISFTDCVGALVNGCTFKNYSKTTMPGAIDIEPDVASQTTRSIHIVDNYFTGNTGSTCIKYNGNATALTNKTRDIQIRNNSFVANTTSWQIVMSSAEDVATIDDMGVVIDGNYFNVSSAKQTFDIPYGIRGVTFSNNTIIGGQKFSIGDPTTTTVNAVDFNLINNTFEDSGTSTTCLQIASVNKINIIGNTFDNPGYGTATYAIQFFGDGVTTTSDNVRLIDNNFVKGASQTWAVRLISHTTTTANNVVTGNRNIGGSLSNGLNGYSSLGLVATITPDTVSGLPSASTVGAGAKAFVTDANATTFASIVAAGGANGVPVYSDGTNWRIG